MLKAFFFGRWVQISVEQHPFRGKVKETTMAAIIQGKFQPGGGVKLNQAPNLLPGPVVVTVQPAPAAMPPKGGLAELIDEIRRGQQSRGYQGRSAEEIEAVRQEGEAEYEQRRHSPKRGV
jgi:hypothetical protein